MSAAEWFLVIVVCIGLISTMRFNARRHGSNINPPPPPRPEPPPAPPRKRSAP